MSLIMALANRNGIAISGDRRASTSWYDPNTNKITYTYHSDRTQKVFRTDSNHGIAFCGYAKLDNGENASDVIYDVIQQFNRDNFTVTQEFYILFKVLLSKTKNNVVAIIVAGIENGEYKILSANTKDQVVSEPVIDGFGFTAAGVSEYIYDLGNFPTEEASKMSLYESVDFLEKLNESVYDFIEEHNYKPVISKECDILVIDESGANWVVPSTRRPWMKL